jgi:hypothetical protein
MQQNCGTCQGNGSAMRQHLQLHIAKYRRGGTIAPHSTPARRSNQRETSLRNIILHYHFYKNAGTSVDEVLKHNFKQASVSREFEPGKRQGKHALVAEWIAQTPEAIAFSSHTAELPPPVVRKLKVYPIVFVRHPIDRVASVYAFEKQQAVDNLGTQLARNLDLAGYVKARLAMTRDAQCRNFHVRRLSSMFGPEFGNEFERARNAIARLPFVGVVDQFDESMQLLKQYLAGPFPQFEPLSVRKNSHRDGDLSLKDRLRDIRKQLGKELYQELLDANAHDMELYKLAQVKQRRAQRRAQLKQPTPVEA